ncbi:hypothetical protein A2U01_0059919, partial [Trifolium medium]|nr:hypothetical protein [Trifolium medium]
MAFDFCVFILSSHSFDRRFGVFRNRRLPLSEVVAILVATFLSFFAVVAALGFLTK